MHDFWDWSTLFSAIKSQRSQNELKSSLIKWSELLFTHLSIFNSPSEETFHTKLRLNHKWELYIKEQHLRNKIRDQPSFCVLLVAKRFQAVLNEQWSIKRSGCLSLVWVTGALLCDQAVSVWIKPPEWNSHWTNHLDTRTKAALEESTHTADSVFLSHIF